jgi:hypothetical protein
MFGSALVSRRMAANALRLVHGSCRLGVMSDSVPGRCSNVRIAPI